jgi:hypothetical protein
MVELVTTHGMPRYSKENLLIDLREIRWILENRPQIMASEYVELSLAKKEIIRRLLTGDYTN